MELKGNLTCALLGISVEVASISTNFLKQLKRLFQYHIYIVPLSLEPFFYIQKLHLLAINIDQINSNCLEPPFYSLIRDKKLKVLGGE